MRVLLLHDEVGEGSSTDELDVLAQMAAIERALSALGHESSRLACTLNLEAARDAIVRSGAELVFNLVESLASHGRLIHLAPATLEAMAVPYTGCPAEAVFATSNKLLAKRLLAAAGIATPRHFTLESLERGEADPAGRCIIKSVWEHASRGLDEDSIVRIANARDGARALRDRLPILAGEGFAEEYIEGREFNLSLLGIGSVARSKGGSRVYGCTVLPPAEIIFEGYDAGKPRIVGYRAKWDEASYEYSHTPRRFEFEDADRPLLQQLKVMAQECWACFGLRGYARVDFRVDEGGRPFVLEVNTNPCLSPDAGFAAALHRDEIPFADAIARILADVPGTRQ